MKTIKPNEQGEVTFYGTVIKLEKGAKTVVVFGDEYKIDWGKKTKEVVETPTTDEPTEE